MLRSGDPALIAAAMEAADSWSPEDVPILVPLLAREPWLGPAVRAIAAIGVDGVPYLNSVLSDETADFVIRRRIPRVLGRIDHPVADRTLIDALDAGRFEVRYRAALALYQRRRAGLAEATGNWRDSVWAAIRAQLGREKPVWELARLLDAEPEDGFVERRVGARGELSLEHTFRTLSLVLDADSVRAAYHGILLDDPELKSFALEYLEQVLPADVRLRLWPFIGDLSAAAERRAIRELDDVVADLLQTGATLFGSPEDREALESFLRKTGKPDDGT
jgi:HEAT repeat protein